MKKVLSITFVCMTLLLMLSGCVFNNDMLSGRYESESGEDTIQFKSDGTFMEIDNKTGFAHSGTYQKNEDGTYTLYIKYGSFIITIYAEPITNGIRIHPEKGTDYANYYKK